MEANNELEYSEILYYYIGCIEYDKILEIVNKIVLENVVNATNGLFIMLDKNDIKPYFATSMEDENKQIIFSVHQKNISRLKIGEVFIIYNDIFYKINDAFHITTLYTGGKINDKCNEMESQLGKEMTISLNKIAISKQFITIGTGDINPYYGNEIKHITIGLSKSEKKIYPKDSPTAFSNGIVYDIDLKIKGIANKFMKQ